MRDCYNNGDILAGCCDCDTCQPVTVNGVVCHEAGCPNAWRDYQRVCKWCGCEFWPENPGQDCCCEDCAAAYHW